jgi:hypothetical protein
MVDFENQMSLNHKNGKAKPGPVMGFANQAASVASTAMELAELQFQLIKADAAKATREAVAALVGTVAGICALLAGLPIVALGMASLLDDLTMLNAWQSQLLVGVLFVIAAGAVVAISLRSLQKTTAQFDRSRRELAENVAWLKTVVGSTPDRRQHKKSVIH